VRIVSHEHGMGAWRPDRAVRVADGEWGRQPLFLWVVPARISGSWQMSAADGGELRLELKQTFQRFRGSAVANGRTNRIRNGRIHGAKVSFDLIAANGRKRHFSGSLTPDGAIEGRGWHAKRKT
jgi:hypothetical protein